MTNIKTINIKTKFIVYLIALVVATSCNAQKKDTMSIETNFKRKYDSKTGLEVYNFEVAKGTKKTDPMVVKTSDEWTILINSMGEYGASYDEYSPANEFTTCIKQFDSKGRLREKTYTIQENLRIGIWEYYDENGNVVKTVDYNERLTHLNIKLEDILLILENEGLINRKTGEGGLEIVIRDNYAYVNYLFNINLVKDENDNYYWHIISFKNRPNFSNYKIDANTGILRKDVTFFRFHE